MGYFTEEFKHPTSYNLQRDLGEINRTIGWGSNMASRRFFFLGEDHDFAMDLERRIEVVRHFGNNTRIIFISERGMKGPRDVPLTDYIVNKGSVHELNTTSSSFDHTRNIEIVAQILKTIASDPDYRQRMPLIVFGQDHEKGIRMELQKQTPSDYKLRWWSYPSIMQQIEDLPDPVNLTLAGYRLVGFTKAPLMHDATAHKWLLTKGVWHEPSDIEVFAPYYPPKFNVKLTLYAVYGRSNMAHTTECIEHMSTNGGKCMYNAHTADAIRLVVVKNGGEYERLQKTVAI